MNILEAKAAVVVVVVVVNTLAEGMAGLTLARETVQVLVPSEWASAWNQQPAKTHFEELKKRSPSATARKSANP